MSRRCTVYHRPANEPAVALDDVSICYFAALIEGIRLISAKADELQLAAPVYDANALIHYVQIKGEQLCHLWGAQPRGPAPTR